MERGVLRKDGKCYIELPPEFSPHEKIELFPLRSGYYLLSVPLSAPEKRPVRPPVLAEQEKAFLRKLLAISFGQRTPSKVDAQLNPGERALLKALVAKDYVNIFQGKKYPQGVYNIRDSVYPLLSSAPRPVPSAPPAASSPAEPPSPILSEGYAVFDDAIKANRFSAQLRQQGKSAAIIGVKGFDGKFYAVTKSYFSKNGPLLLSALEKQARTPETLAKQCNLPVSACLALLHVLSEEGDVVEKRKGVFAVA